jgi:hypothetical protein
MKIFSRGHNRATTTRRIATMKRVSQGAVVRWFFMLGGAFCFFCAISAGAQSSNSEGTENSSAIEAYDMSREVKIQGTIREVVNSGESAPLGMHLLIDTPQGVIDAHIGALNSASQKLLGLAAGQTVELTGMIESENGNSVMLARLLTTPTRVVILRNENGIPVRSLVRGPGPAAPASVQKGGL